MKARKKWLEGLFFEPVPEKWIGWQFNLNEPTPVPFVPGPRWVTKVTFRRLDNCLQDTVAITHLFFEDNEEEWFGDTYVNKAQDRAKDQALVILSDGFWIERFDFGVPVHRILEVSVYQEGAEAE